MKAAALEKKWKREVGASETNPNALWEKLETIRRETLLVRPPKSFTTKEYAAKLGLNDNMALKELYRMLRMGKVKKHKAQGSSAIYWTVV